MTRVDLEAAERMLDEATPGPWRPCPQKSFVFGPNHEMIASRSRVQDDGEPEKGTVEIRGFGAGLPMDANHDLIVAAPTLIRALIEEVRWLREAMPSEDLARVRAALNEAASARARTVDVLGEAVYGPTPADAPGPVYASETAEMLAERAAEMIDGLARERDGAFHRGLHEGVALARAKFRRRLGSSPGIGPMEFDDWSEVDAELERRMSIPRASSAPSDKLSEEER